MQPSEINSNDVVFETRLESQRVKYKLHITLRFATKTKGVQKRLSEIFKSGVSDDCISSFYTDDFREGCFNYEDSDEGEYIIERKIFTINEDSPSAMNQASKDVDSYISGFCLKPDVEELVVSILIPIINECSVIPRIFLNSYPFQTFACISHQGQFNKINYKKCNIILYNFDTIIGNYTSDNKVAVSNKPISKLIVQLSALMSYYIYFYIDMHEQKNWSFFKRDINDALKIQKFVADENIPPKSFWGKVWNALTNLPGVTWNSVKGTFDFFCNYDGHLRNRIYKRIYDILCIVYGDKQPESFIVDKICELLSTYKLKGDAFGLYDFYDCCGYWKYLKDSQLQEACRNWDVMRVDGKPICDAGWFSGYGAALFTNNQDYIYTFKGTDFDSYGRDWLATNVLQGLTGFSLQHHIASSKAKEYDRLIGSNGSLWFTGHSLGGGLASAATITTEKREGITFNAAGLNVIGVKTKQLFKFNSQTLHPSLDWIRVTPYRIKGEVLDTVQKFARLAVPILERGYGKNSVDIEFVGKDVKCAARHGINNFLYRNVMRSLAPFNQMISTTGPKDKSTSNNRIVKAYFKSRDIAMEGRLS